MRWWARYIRHPLVLAIVVAVVLMWLLFFLNEDTLGDVVNGVVLITVGIALALSIWVMAIRTSWDRWTWLGAGMMLIFAGLLIMATVLFLEIIGSPVRDAIWLNALRSCWVTGGVAAAYGLWQERQPGGVS